MFNTKEDFTTAVDRIIRQALTEDIQDGDLTSNATIPADQQGTGRMVAKASGVVAGLEIAARTFALLDTSVQFAPLVEEGTAVQPGDTIAEVAGPTRALLSGERTALNLLQRLSGIATATRTYTDAIAGTRAVILDTRKTAPGLRLLDKWAVQQGGGQNHRIGLFDMALIKENHIAAAGGITPAVERVRAYDPHSRPIEVEVKNLTELQEALALNVDRIMLDNMSLDEMREAVNMTHGRVPLEASGNVSQETIRAIAQTGVDFISIGRLTHSVQALDISFLLD